MGRAPCCDKKGVKRGIWAPEEDQILVSYIQQHGHGNWRALPEQAGLLRCGKSCRLRWINYLQPDIKRGNFTAEEEETIMKMHEELGNRWSAIAAKLPGRTDNEVKNHWRTNLHKRVPNKTVEANATNESLSTEENPATTQRRQDSEEPSQTVATNGTSQTVATNATSQTVAANATSATASEDGADGKKSDVVLNEDFWADVLSDSSFSLDIESGFEVQSMSSLSAPFMGDVATISEAWWPGDDNLDCCLGSSSDTAHQ